MNIAVIGYGNVGGALGHRWEQAGHTVVYGGRDPGGEKALAFRRAHGGSPSITTVAPALAGADVVLLATPYPGALAVAEAHAAALAGRVVIDATNPIGPGLVLSVGHTTSGAEQIAARASGARVVKAFNTYGWENFADAVYASGKPVMLMASDDRAALDVVGRLAACLGFEPVTTGGLIMARYLEPMAMVWIQMGRVQGLGSGFAWSMLRR